MNWYRVISENTQSGPKADPGATRSVTPVWDSAASVSDIPIKSTPGQLRLHLDTAYS